MLTAIRQKLRRTAVDTMTSDFKENPKSDKKRINDRIQLSKICYSGLTGGGLCRVLYRRNLEVPADIESGGDDRDRTGDHRLAKPALYQLSYIPTAVCAAGFHSCAVYHRRGGERMVARAQRQ